VADPNSQDAQARVSSALRARRLLADWGVAVAGVETGRVTLKMTQKPRGTDPGDPPHGPFDRAILTALGDAACWLAVISATAPHQSVATLEMKVDLITTEMPIVALEATGEVKRLGRSVSAAYSTVMGLDEAGERHKLCLVQATMLAQ